MLLIAGRRITSPDDEDIAAVFGLSYEQDRNVADIIDWCIEDQNYHYFGGPEAFRSYVMGSVTTGGHLKILCTHSRYHSAYTITMSGSRSEDAKRANAKAGLHGTPSGYTWHHAENIRHSGSGYRCKMYLIKKSYHDHNPHSGGVAEYERYTGKTYT